MGLNIEVHLIQDTFILCSFLLQGEIPTLYCVCDCFNKLLKLGCNYNSLLHMYHSIFLLTLIWYIKHVILSPINLVV